MSDASSTRNKKTYAMSIFMVFSFSLTVVTMQILCRGIFKHLLTIQQIISENNEFKYCESATPKFNDFF